MSFSTTSKNVISELPKFPERVVNGDYQADAEYAERVRIFATHWVEFYIDGYKHRSKHSKYLALTMRTVAFIAIVFGGVILVGRMLSSTTQAAVMKWAFNSNLTDVPAEAGLILFALAAGIMAVDKFGSISEGWMRYNITELSLRKMLVDFQIDGVDDKLKRIAEMPRNELTADAAKAEFARIKSFLDAIFDLVRHETQEWADEFRRSRSDLEGYLKLQEVAAKTDVKANNPPANSAEPA